MLKKYDKNGTELNLLQDTDTESGNNDKGYYRKSHDGVLECWIKKNISTNINIASGSSFYGDCGIYEFPYEFKELLYLNASLIADVYSASYYGAIGTTVKKTGNLYFVRTTQTTVTGYILIYATGRWK